MALELPTEEVKIYIEEALEQFGILCTVDKTQSTKIMISDLLRSYSNIMENQKQAVVSKDITVIRGSEIEFFDGRMAIVFSIPNDDLVSLSMKILMCNAKLTVADTVDDYNDDGDIIGRHSETRTILSGFIERLTAKEKQFDVGLLHDAVLRFVTYVDADIGLDDGVEFKTKKYRVIDIDDITEGLLVVQLASVRA